ncbi:hypothetical protein JCM17380_32180 [Desulfosporosinus burensis]
MEKLDKIVSHMPDSSKTYLAWLREIPGTFSPDKLDLLEKKFYVLRKYTPTLLTVLGRLRTLLTSLVLNLLGW